MDSSGKRFSGCRRNGVDHRMAIAKSHSSSSSSTFSALILERKLLKEAEEEEKGKKTLGLGDDCSSCIFLWLPIDALQRSSCVCKPWNSIIKNPSFVESHLHHSETVLLCLTFADTNAQPGQTSTSSVPISKAKTFSVESHLLAQRASIFQEEMPRICMRQNYLHFLEIKDGVSFADVKSFNISCSGTVLGSCNGLLLLQNKLKYGLVVMNPVSRKLTALPAGTIVHLSKESYGFAFKRSTKEHVAVHLFQEDSGYVSCEILTVEKRKWAMVNGPPSGLIPSFGRKPVFANEALHWLHVVAHNDCILSMGIEDEKFSTITLPTPVGFHDGIIEMGGFLCFVTHELNQLDIWALLKGSTKESWTKQHTISSSVLPDMAPLSGSRYGRWMVLRSNSVFHVEDEVEDVIEDEDEEVEGEEGLDAGSASAANGQGVGGEVRSLYVYDFHLQAMNKVRTKHLPPAFHTYLPHVNSLLWC